ncbi:hypothetical protein NQZ68_020355 [Dissostichus eleginoides]|nr:hypothetical protein NQZ68_020355 [Dissostichus eleginoides]
MSATQYVQSLGWPFIHTSQASMAVISIVILISRPSMQMARMLEVPAQDSFDNALATSFISLKDERDAGNVISLLRQGRQRLRIKREEVPHN